MVKSRPPSPLRIEDYEAIQDAVMETERGRWFLREYAQRNRSADTEVLLSAIQKLHDNLIGKSETPDASRITLDLADMANAIAETKKQISAMGRENGDDDKITIASSELDAIVSTAEKATGDILNAAEQVQEIAWSLREKDIDNDASDKLDKYATDIYTACSFQDLTGQRTDKVINVLQFIENRVMAMMDIWKIEEGDEDHAIEQFDGIDNRPDAHLLNGPQLEHKASSQNDIDDMMSEDMFENRQADDIPQNVEGPSANETLLIEASENAHQETVNSSLQQNVFENDEGEFDVTGPEIIDCLAIGCDTPYDSVCSYQDCTSHIDESAKSSNIDLESELPIVQPSEEIEIGTAEEFAETASSQEDSKPEASSIDLEQPVEDPVSNQMPILEPSDSLEQNGQEYLTAQLIDTADIAQPDVEEIPHLEMEIPVLEPENETEVAAIEISADAGQQNAIIEPPGDDTSLSSLNLEQRQVIFS